MKAFYNKLYNLSLDMKISSRARRGTLQNEHKHSILNAIIKNHDQRVTHVSVVKFYKSIDQSSQVYPE